MAYVKLLQNRSDGNFVFVPFARKVAHCAAGKNVYVNAADFVASGDEMIISELRKYDARSWEAELSELYDEWPESQASVFLEAHKTIAISDRPTGEVFINKADGENLLTLQNPLPSNLGQTIVELFETID